MPKYQKAIFAAGCFWGVQYKFSKISGVIETKVGYTGGKYKNPTYKFVCMGITHHAEAVLVKFNPKKVSYNKLLSIFWKIHDPTTRNKQGFDMGTQYRSAIFYLNKEQKELALKSKEKTQKNFSKEIVTEITKATKFYLAEEYHQNYYIKNNKKVC